MTSQEHKNYVINPFTNRLIKRGSKTYKRLVSAKLLDEELVKSPRDNLVMQAKDSSEAKEITSRMSKKTVGKNKIVTRRGDKVLRANRRPTMQETIDKVSDIAVNTVLENRDDLLNQNFSDDEMDDYIRRMIQIKLIGGQTKPIPKKESVESYETDSDDYSE